MTAAGPVKQSRAASPAERSLDRALADARDLGQLLYSHVAFPAVYVEMVGQGEQDVELAALSALGPVRVLLELALPGVWVHADRSRAGLQNSQ
jgi:hypothetical protein